MRLLFLSDFYQPLEIGGWEQLTWELVQRLEQRGHAALVLTSDHRWAEAPKNETSVRRVLKLQASLAYYSMLDFFLHNNRWEANNRRILSQMVAEFRPDVFFIHSMWNLSPCLPALAEQLCPGRVVYFIASDWPYTPNVHEQFWRQPAQKSFLKLPRRILAALASTTIRKEVTCRQSLQFQHVIAVSRLIKTELVEQAHLPVENICVIYNGIDPQPFLAFSRPAVNPSVPGLPSLLCAGGLSWNKGFHTVIEALAGLESEFGIKNIPLTIVGSGNPDYEKHLRSLVIQFGLQERVHFKGWVPHEQIPTLLNQHDVFIMSSRREAMSRMLQEALLSGMVVIGTDSTGNREILVDGENSLLYAPEDAPGLGQQIKRLLDEPGLRQRLSQAAPLVVHERFTLERMVTEVEAYLLEISQGEKS